MSVSRIRRCDTAIGLGVGVREQASAVGLWGKHGGAHVNVYREAKVLDYCAQLVRRDLTALIRSTTQRDERIHCATHPGQVRVRCCRRAL